MPLVAVCPGALLGSAGSGCHHTGTDHRVHKTTGGGRWVQLAIGWVVLMLGQFITCLLLDETVLMAHAIAHAQGVIEHSHTADSELR
jgi:hypothetical protein